MKQHEVILVDEKDNAIGIADKILAHRQGFLHRAFSVLIFNTSGEWLLQQRADDKYHSGGLWTNTCCSHPYPGEDVFIAANRRLAEEMGLHCHLEKHGELSYRVDFDNGMTEHEYDHVFTGTSDSLPIPDTKEVKSWKYITCDELQGQISKYPEKFTYWFKLIFEKVYPDLNKIASWKKSS